MIQSCLLSPSVFDSKFCKLSGGFLPLDIQISDDCTRWSAVAPGDELPKAQFLAFGQDLDAAIRTIPHPTP
jgi:hypothetical protein